MSRLLVNAFLTCFVLFVPLNLQATIINYEDPAECNWWWHKDLELDFLDLTETEGFSYLHAKNLIKLDAEFRSEGWQLATQQQAYDLYKSFYDGTDNNFSTGKLEAAQLWFSLFGVPRYGNYGVYTWKTLAGIEDATGEVYYGKVVIYPAEYGYTTYNHERFFFFKPADLYHNYNRTAIDYSSAAYETTAVLLVRPHAVPEPTALLLLGLGGVILRSKRRFN